MTDGEALQATITRIQLIMFQMIRLSLAGYKKIKLDANHYEMEQYAALALRQGSVSYMYKTNLPMDMSNRDDVDSYERKCYMAMGQMMFKMGQQITKGEFKRASTLVPRVTLEQDPEDPDFQRSLTWGIIAVPTSTLIMPTAEQVRQYRKNASMN